MTKREVLNVIADSMEITPTEAEYAYDALWGAYIDEFAETGVLKTPIANFYVAPKKERTYKIPSGETIVVPAGKRVRVSVRKVLKDLVEDNEIAA